MVTEKASKHDIQLFMDAAEAPEVLVADERKVKQVLWVESAGEGKGSVFKFVLPLEAAGVSHEHARVAR